MPYTRDDKRLKPLSPKEQRRVAKQRFVQTRRIERDYSRRLRAVARTVGNIVKGMAPGGVPISLPKLTAALNSYADLLQPWASAVAERMIGEVDARNESAWIQAGRDMGREIRRELQSAPTGQTMRQLQAEQVALITSLPREAAERVHELSMQAITEGGRAKELAERIYNTGAVTESRAMTIARTEVARAASNLTEARAKHIGSTQYEWSTSQDLDVRPEHKQLGGKIFSWSDPPVAGSRGERAHPGTIYNCRCVALPIIPDD